MSDAVTVSLFVVGKLRSVLQEAFNRDRKVLDALERIKRHLVLMQLFHQDAEEWEGTSEMMRVLVEDIQDVARQMEDVLDEYMIHAPRVFSTTSPMRKFVGVLHDIKHWASVQALQSKLASTEASMRKITESPLFLEGVRIASTVGSRNQDREEYLELEDEEIIGIDSQKEHLITLLTKGEGGECKTISVVGPSGAGKTVLVRSVYQTKSLIGQFDCYAWLSLSHPNTSTNRDDLLNLLTQFSRGMLGFREESAAMELEQYLVDKRYLLVLDGIRTEGEWRSIKSALPDCGNGSRVIITTQNGDVAANCAASDDHMLRVNGLAWEDSWRLFCNKAYGNGENCPPELLDWSEMIVKRCEGLPQAISAVGALLLRKKREVNVWRPVYANLMTEIQAKCINTMFLPSYSDLPVTLKSCLLYFSLFPEDYSIKRERLIRLWLSEGFIDKSGPETVPETIAENILNELISRNLVSASSRDFSGRVKSCHVSNLMREFICQKAKENKFTAVVTDRDMDKRDGRIYRRLSIENASSGVSRTGDLHLDRVRSLFIFGLDRASSKMIAATLERIRLLKVLHLENAHLNSFPECVLNAALLRYLSLRDTNVDKIPKTIEKLKYLEYLDLKYTKLTRLPEEIFSLHYLQHLLVGGDSLGVQIFGKMRGWPFIQKLSIIQVNHTPRFFEMLGLLTLLKKLGLDDLREEDGRLLSKCIANMPHLSTLELTTSGREEILDLQHMAACPEFLRHLYLRGRLAVLPRWISPLMSLVRLRLYRSQLDASPTESLQSLPNLMELKMVDAFTGKTLSIDEGGFPKLRALHIAEFEGLEKIVLCTGGMPKLQKLTIANCMHLYHLPSGIERLNNLEELQLVDMPHQFTMRLTKAGEDRWMINHVPIVHSFNVSDELQNLSSHR